MKCVFQHLRESGYLPKHTRPLLVFPKLTHDMSFGGEAERLEDVVRNGETLPFLCNACSRTVCVCVFMFILHCVVQMSPQV